MKALEITLAALGGAVVGAAAALLIAPQSGRRTRAQLRSFIREKCPCAHASEVDRIADELEDRLEETITETVAKAKK